jgi:hypothetical protein
MDRIRAKELVTLSKEKLSIFTLYKITAGLSSNGEILFYQIMANPNRFNYHSRPLKGLRYIN